MLEMNRKEGKALLEGFGSDR